MTTPPIPGPAEAPDGLRVFTLQNSIGMTVAIGERSAAPQAWHVPDRYGRMADVLLPDPDADGRSAPRWQGRHGDGGVSLWRRDGGAGLRLHYRLDNDGSLVVDCDAMAGLPPPPGTAAPHLHFNLNGGHAGVDDHLVRIDADYYVNANAEGVPPGLAGVGGTPFDFRLPAPIGARLCWPGAGTGTADRFDHCYLVRGHEGGQSGLQEVACVVDPRSGRRLQVYTTESALRFCTGDGFSLQAQAAPAAVAARPGTEPVWRHTTIYRLSLQG